MRNEIKILIEQAEKDLEVAEKNFKLEEYYVTAFLCQQSMEKALKAIYILKKGKSAGTTHSLIYLAKEINLPIKFHNLLKSLTPEFIITRYPDVAGDAPYKLYSHEKVKDYLINSKELMKWLKDQIKKQ